jgi:hypothetical protein
MINNPVKIFYFSATETTKKIVTGIAGKLVERSGGKSVVNIDFTCRTHVRNQQRLLKTIL